MKIRYRKKAFTIVELLVAIAVVSILVTVAISVVISEVRNAESASILNNARQIYIATFSISLDNEKAGSPSIWPSASCTNSNLSAFINELGFNRGDVQRLLSGAGITVAAKGELGALTIKCNPNPPFRFYAVGDRPDDGKQVFLTSFNVQCAPRSITIDENAVPFGGLWGILFRKGGSGDSVKAVLLKEQAIIDTIPENQTLDLNWR